MANHVYSFYGHLHNMAFGKPIKKQCKAISMYQPYAWLIANGHMDIDDRNWNTNYRGKLAIHASKKFDLNYYLYVSNVLKIKMPAPEDFEYGGIIAFCNLDNCLTPNCKTNIPTQRRTHGGGNYYGLLLTNITKVNLIPYKGMPGLFNYTQ